MDLRILIFLSRFYIIFAIIFKIIKCEDVSSSSRFAQMRAIFPNPSSFTEPQWRTGIDDNYNYNQHACKRKCVANQTMTCYYYLIVHYDNTMGAECELNLKPQFRFKMGNKEYVDEVKLKAEIKNNDCKFADGVPTQIMAVNGLLPGPVIEVCEGDTIVADVINGMHEMTTIHWHGMHQRNTPHMDGVPHVTQYPIEAGQAFRYRFLVDRGGTNWWHSHVDHQRAYGLAGIMIARQPDSANMHVNLYDFDYTEHAILIQDWVHNLDESTPKNILINGKGLNVHDEQQPSLLATFSVTRGGRYRFRVVFNGISNCPVSFSIDQHDLVLISNDGNDIEPITVQKFTLNEGERFDFVLHANQQNANYWIRMKGCKFCEANKLHQGAILHYVGANQNAKPNGELSYSYERDGIEFNPLNFIENPSSNVLTVIDTNSIEKIPKPPAKPFKTYYVSMNIRQHSNFLFQMDDISFTLPKMSLMQARNLGIDGFFCNKTQQAEMGVDCKTRHCKCTNIIQVPAFQTVEFVITSKSEISHPVHIHGYTFRVVGMGILGEKLVDQVEEIDRKSPLRRRVNKAPLKDTVQVPGFGYTILRFYTDNPGYWIIHCHISTHSENGMAAVLRIGEEKQMKLCPVSNCGLCSSAL